MPVRGPGAEEATPPGEQKALLTRMGDVTTVGPTYPPGRLFRSGEDMVSPGVREKISDLVRPGLVPGRIRVRALRAAGVDVGERVIVGPGLRLRGSGRLVLSDGVGMSHDCTIDCNGGVFIGTNARFGPNCMLITSSHEMGGPEQRVGDLTVKPVTIGAGAWLAAGVIVLPGVTIGEGAVVAAGVVVRRNVPANTLWASQGPRQYMKLTV